MFVKAGIFNRNNRLLQKEGDPVKADPVALFRQQSPDKTALAVKDLDGVVTGRQDRVGSNRLLGQR